MAGHDNLHSRVVAWLKVILPLSALVLLSTLFLISNRIGPDDELPYAEAEIDELARTPRLTAPEYAGVTEDGAAISVTAAEARPDPADPGRATGTGLVARLDTPDGVRTDLTATAGEIDGTARLLTLTGEVAVQFSNGLRLTTGHLVAALDRTRVTAPGAIEAEAPMGRISAGGAELTTRDGAYVLVFQRGVKLVYDPRK